MLLPGTGSVVEAELTVAEFTIGSTPEYPAGTLNFAMIVRVWPWVMAASAQGKAVVQSPVFETKVRPAGRRIGDDRVRHRVRAQVRDHDRVDEVRPGLHSPDAALGEGEVGCGEQRRGCAQEEEGREGRADAPRVATRARQAMIPSSARYGGPGQCQALPDGRQTPPISRRATYVRNLSSEERQPVAWRVLA